MDVFLANEQEVPVDERRITSLAHHALSSEDVDDPAELSLLLVTSDHIRRLNARFSGNDYATDVLAFPMSEDDEEDMMLGDVVLCPEVARRNASDAGRAVSDEIDLLVVHGILHLLGYDHHRKEDQVRMDQRQREILAAFDGAKR